MISVQILFWSPGTQMMLILRWSH